MQMVNVVKLAALGLALSVLGCGGDGLSEADAQLRCNQLQARDQCVTTAARDACISCYEECGDKCTVVNTCPAKFTCDTPSSSTSTSTSSSK
jgi:anaerobic selenocysteine-containing dehydrogenase